MNKILLCPRGNIYFHQEIELHCIRLVMSEYIFIVRYKLKQNILRHLFALEVFSAGKLSMCICQEISISLNNYESCRYTFIVLQE